MNVVTFNNTIERAFATFPLQKYLNKFRGWRTPPLFDYTTTFENEKEKVAELIKDEGLQFRDMPWPFELFRLALIETAVPWMDEVLGPIGKGRYVTHYVVTRIDGEMAIYAEVKEMWDETKSAYSAKNQKMSFLIDELDRGNADELLFNFSMNIKGEWVNVSKLLRMASQPIVGAAVTGLATFLFDSMAPTTHIAVVHPAIKEPRSVEWHRQRTHYTLIAHGHPANNPAVERGANVATDSAAELQRMAHARRAHFRVLKSERFRFARGKRIFVRAAWIGPKEWRDDGSKQIYRILEPVGRNNNNPKEGD